MYDMFELRARMKDVVVVGAAEIGTTLAGVLAATNDYQVALVDHSADALVGWSKATASRTEVADVEDSSRAARFFRRRPSTARLRSSGGYSAEGFP